MKKRKKPIACGAVAYSVRLLGDLCTYANGHCAVYTAVAVEIIISGVCG